jgi:2-dehydro-3-deoxy-L-rhamnonate dehydrogenase (NAD+)
MLKIVDVIAIATGTKERDTFMSFRLANMNVVVTGAAQGIGYAIAKRFNELEANVCGWDRHSEAMSDDKIFKHVESVDVTDEVAVDTAFKKAIQAMGRIDIVIANAGVNGPTKPAWEYTLSEWNNVLNVDLTGVFLTTRACVPHMQQNNYGRIVIVSSVAGKEGNPGACAYGAAKAGVIGYAKGLARELLPSNITVNTVAPVITETPLLNEMTNDYIADKKSRIPMGRFCTAGEIADMTAWVASPLCSFTTGQTFDVTGGRATY